MATLAEKLRSEFNNEFLQVRDELDDYVMSQIRVSGSAYVGATGCDNTLIETQKYGMYSGIKRISTRLFDAARTYYKEQGLFFRIDYSPMGTIRRGFFVSIID